MTEVSTARSGAIDAVRVLGILAVIAGHTLDTPLVRPLLYTWHVPLFFFLAGYFWSSRRGIKDELAKRTRTLAIPYAVWFVLIAIPFLALDPIFETTTWSRLISPLYSGENSAMPYTTFWFVAVLFASTVLLRCLWRLPRPVVWSIAVAAAVASYWAGDFLAETPLSIGSALPCLAFLVLGTAAQSLRPSVKAPARTGIVLLTLAAVCIGVGFAAPLDIKPGDFGTPIVSMIVATLIAMGLILVAEPAFERLPAWVGTAATRLSYGGFMVVLTHPLVLWLMLTFAPRVPSWLLFVVCAAVPWAIALVVLRTRVSPWVTGVRQLA